MPEIDPAILRALEKVNIKLEDALAYAEKYISIDPNIKNNIPFCVRLYLQTKGYSLTELMEDNFVKLNQMTQSGTTYKTSIILSEEIEPLKYIGCSECSASVRNMYPEEQIKSGDNFFCTSRRCNATRQAIEHRLRKFWAGDDTGEIQVIFNERLKLDDNCIGQVLKVRGQFKVGKNGIPSLYVISFTKNNNYKTPAEVPPLSMFPPETKPQVDVGKIDEQKQKSIEEKIQRFLEVYRIIGAQKIPNSQLPLTLFERWINANFPGVDYLSILAKLNVEVVDNVIRATKSEETS